MDAIAMNEAMCDKPVVLSTFGNGRRIKDQIFNNLFLTECGDWNDAGYDNYDKGNA